MRVATFFELNEQNIDLSAALHNAAIDIILEHYQARRWVTVLCVNKKQAEQLDELMWQSPNDRFIAHNLVGEGPKQGSPVEITWLGQSIRARNVLINLSQEPIDLKLNARHVVDFVPHQSDEKQKARERYRELKQAGVQMEFVTLA